MKFMFWFGVFSMTLFFLSGTFAINLRRSFDAVILATSTACCMWMTIKFFNKISRLSDVENEKKKMQRAITDIEKMTSITDR